MEPRHYRSGNQNNDQYTEVSCER